MALTLVVLGTMGRVPFGGHAWSHMSWLLGLARLGHDVWYVEDDVVWPYDPERNAVTDDCGYAVRHIAACMARIGLAERWAFRFAERDGACWGLESPALDALYARSDALINLCGATRLREPHFAAPFRILLQTDPVVGELRVASGAEHAREPFEAHHLVATYGENFGAPDCPVPLNGYEAKYRRTRQPVALDWWPMHFDANARHFTTIGNYRQTGYDVTWRGETYTWSKHREWEKFIGLPRRTRQGFELALQVEDAADRARLDSFGWRIVPPNPMSLDVFDGYPGFIRRSRAELTVAKDQNVRLNSGWFSERDACYLASGKPVVAQDTGFGKFLPTGAGLFAVSDVDAALAAIEAINADYRRHCDAARAIAEEHLEASRVAARLLEDVGLA